MLVLLNDVCSYYYQVLNAESFTLLAPDSWLLASDS